MGRKEINLFGTSFLDLLSGALGAVIILFVLVPKMTRTEVEMLDKVKTIEAIAVDLDELIDKLENSVPKELLEQIEKELSAMKDRIARLQTQLSELEHIADAVTKENTALREKVSEQQEEIDRLKKQLSDVSNRVQEIEENNHTANTVEKTLGVFARFGILCRWEETDADVDIGVQKFGTDEGQCWRMHPSKPWGILGEDVRERVEDTRERFELFYVPEIHPDVYTAWTNIYEHSPGMCANVYCTLIFHPGQPDEQRHEIGPIVLSGSQTKCFVTFRLTAYGFEILPHREPLWGNGRVVK